MSRCKKANLLLTAGVLLALTGAGQALAHASFELEPLVVEAYARKVLPGGYVNTGGQVGLLGKRESLNTPFTVGNFTEQSFQDFVGPNQAVDNVLVNMPSVTQVGTMLHQDFAIRGQYIDGSSAGYMNGVPGMGGQFVNPLLAAESIEIMAGPSKVISGTFAGGDRSGAGMMNFTSKKAGAEPLTRYRQTFSGRSGRVEALDVGHRFGKEMEWGVRVNAQLAAGNPSMYDAVHNEHGFYVNIDHICREAKSNFLIGHRKYEIEKGLRWFGLGKRLTKLPAAPDGSTGYSFDGIEKESWGTMAVLNHEQKLNDNWKAFFNGGLTKGNLRKNITGQGSMLYITSDEGDFDGRYFTRRSPGKKYYGQIGVRGELATGKIKHDIVAAADRSWSKSYVGVVEGYGFTNFPGPGGNIYTGLKPYSSVKIPEFHNFHISSSKYWGWSLVDTMSVDKWDIMLGVHKHNAAVYSYNVQDQLTKSVKSDGMCPSYAVTYKPTDNLSLYASHGEFFDSGFIVGQGYTNEGSVISPAKKKENELGIKYLNKGLLATLAFFDTKAASTMAVYETDDFSDKPYLANDAETEYKGVELSVNGRLSKKLNCFGGFMYMKGVRNKTEKGLLDGYRVNGIPRVNGVLGLQYNPDEHWSLVARGVYTGSAPISDGKFTVPSHLTYDAGVKYKTKLGQVPVTFNAMCYNMTNRNYWIAYGSSLHVSSPRTLMLSAQFDL